VAKPPKIAKTPRPKATDEPRGISELLRAELLRRGMTPAEIAATLRKRKRRERLELAVRPPGRASKDGTPQLAPKPPPSGPPKKAHGGRVSEEACTVADAAAELRLHPKTVLRFIHEGRLPAARLGKSYRLLRADLEAFAGLPARTANPAEAASTTAIVDVPGVGPELAQAVARSVTAALNARPGDAAPLRAEVIHEPDRAHLKLIVVGGLADTASLLGLLRVWLEQLKP
jgi:excisionase family DNA binding protein